MSRICRFSFAAIAVCVLIDPAFTIAQQSPANPRNRNPIRREVRTEGLRPLRQRVEPQRGAPSERRVARTNERRPVRTKVTRPASDPFKMTVELDELLHAWEKRGTQIKKFKCKFTMWSYDPEYGPRNKKGQLIASEITSGELRYHQPDRGSLHEQRLLIFNPKSGKHEEIKDNSGDHWVSDGKSVYEFNSRLKVITQRMIPPEMQGEGIRNGPLPFLFGARASDMKARFFLRENTEPKYRKEEIWLEAYPKWAGDAANYRSVQLIMKRKDFLPYAMRKYAPEGKQYKVYRFTDISINSLLDRKITAPDIPRGWKMVLAKPPTQAAQRKPAERSRRK